MARRQKRKLSKKEVKAQNKTLSFNSATTDASNIKVVDTPVIKKTVLVPETILVRDFAVLLSVPVTVAIKSLMKNGVLKNINEAIDWETAAIVGEDLGYDIKLKSEEGKGKITAKKEKPEDIKDLIERPPVVTIMGHVDHGKTQLLDAIRKTDVVSTESGGITQHIGAYQITFKNKKITFVDTPGHEAFEAMRAHGANITDIVILVVAADDGVKPQTVEAYEHAKRAGVPVIVAINKIDLPTANIIKVKQQLTELGLIPEDMGGKTIVVPLSAKQNLHIDNLLEMILILAEMKNFKTNPKKSASAIVIESHLDPQLGPVANVLVQGGVLKVGDLIVIGETFGKIRLMEDSHKKKLLKAETSTPVKIAGFKEVPAFGEILQAVPDEKTAQIVLSDLKKAQKIKDEVTVSSKKIIPIVLKADVDGSLRAIKDSLKKLENDAVVISIIRKEVGEITDDDVMLASAANAQVIGFKVNISNQTKELLETEKVAISQYNVIYDLINDIKEIVAYMSRKEIEVKMGKAVVLKVFRDTTSEKIVGIKVLSGYLEKGGILKVYHEEKEMGIGKILSLQIEKQSTKKIESVTIGGMRMSCQCDLAEGDELEFYKKELR